MSGYLAGKVWHSGLSPRLKPLAAALADIADQDGSNIYPSVARMAWLVGCSERTVQYQLHELVALGVLVADPTTTRGGRGRTTDYCMDADSLPERAPFHPVNGAKTAPVSDVKGAETAPIETLKGAEGAPIETLKGATWSIERVQLDAQKGAAAVAPDPSLPVQDPSAQTDLVTAVPRSVCAAPRARENASKRTTPSASARAAAPGIDRSRRGRRGTQLPFPTQILGLVACPSHPSIFGRCLQCLAGLTGDAAS